ncbi:DUF2691 family protein [Bacillus sp. PK3_68]|uniref:DUF2691 family protein n=1 Tax=Bacillus sp. PK3_68 TaxID=2027408 RepID=UPI000E73E611|nr:DUF2691 family protein [Bacillus sp. PK3_68]RJS59192.1 hypothetical protein CJ483_03185 [Bacillus sp. PK3_68]
MKRGITFEIPNEYGSLLGDLLEPIDITTFNWRVGDGESYLVGDDSSEEALFSKDVIKGNELKILIEDNRYYLIFVDLQAYPKGEVSEVKTYTEFIESKCELVLLVVDSCYGTIYCKNKRKIELLYRNAKERGFVGVEYITSENDIRTRLSVW